MKIAILGWGSLIWDKRNLRLAGEWQVGGPVLPIEFSRVSGYGRLTLVIDPLHGVASEGRPPFSVPAAVAYVNGLTGDTQIRAFEYLHRAPAEISTPVRRQFFHPPQPQPSTVNV